jgi:hypothetical protein
MTAFCIVEEDRGSYTRSPRHPHNGYYAGDFNAAPTRAGTASTSPAVVATTTRPRDWLFW